MPRYETTGSAAGLVDNDKLKAALKREGARNVRTARQFGWFNQPEVLRFNAPTAEQAQKTLDRALRAVHPNLERGCTPWLFADEIA